MTPSTLPELITPCLLIDKVKMQRNIARLANHIGGMGCCIRPHVKTHKSIAITREILAEGNVNGVTVSTLKEAEYLFRHGITDILYAVGITPAKLAKVAELTSRGCDIKIILDDVAMVQQVIDYASQQQCQFKVLVEIDTDGHRSGLAPSEDALIEVAALLEQSPQTEFLGVMTHAGASYQCFSHQEQLAMARQERDLTLLAVRHLKQAGIDCKIVSIGSTPTAHAIDNLDGITEVRAGVYVFFDLVMAGLKVCNLEDIAVTVLTSVIGHQKRKNWVITDGGWMAMSRDRGTAHQPIDQGYGLVAQGSNSCETDYIVKDANQEHGIICPRDESVSIDFTAFPLGSLLQVLPNHACSTVAQFERFYFVENGKVTSEVDTTRGW